MLAWIRVDQPKTAVGTRFRDFLHNPRKLAYTGGNGSLAPAAELLLRYGSEWPPITKGYNEGY